MSGVASTGLQLKLTNELDFGKKAMQTGKLRRVNAPMLDQLTKKRKVLLKALSKREGVEDAAKEYLAALGAILPGGRADFLRKIIYFYWAPTVGPKTAFAALDTAYEAASVLSNLAITDMNTAQIQIQQSHRTNAERLEKEGYKLYCAAAGKFEKAHEYLSQCPLEASAPWDIHPQVLEGLKTLCLAEAQELSLSKAAKDPENRGRELLAKLGAQAFELYKTAAISFATKSKDDSVVKLQLRVVLKREMLKARTFLLMAGFHSKVDSMAEAISASDQATALVSSIQESFKVNSKRLDTDLSPAVDKLAEDARAMAYKISRDLSFSRVTKLDTPIGLCAPQVLARPTPFEMPESSADWTPEVIQAFELKD